MLPTEAVAESLGENYNVAPTQDIYAVVASGDGSARVDAFHWGLIPSWAKDRKIGSQMINARAETLAEKPAFKGLLPRSGASCRWTASTSGSPAVADGPLNAKGQPLKQPMYIHRGDGEPLAVAGLWTAWKDPDDPEGQLPPQRHGHHDRSERHDAARSRSDAGDAHARAVGHLARPAEPGSRRNSPDCSSGDCADDLLAMHEVSTDVNNVRNNRPDLIAPVE